MRRSGACPGATLLAVLLDARRPQSGQAMLVDRVLPRQEFLDRQGIPAARFFQRKQPAAHRGHHFGLAANTQRFVPGAGRSAIVRGEPSGPMTYLTLGRWGSVISTTLTNSTQLG